MDLEKFLSSSYKTESFEYFISEKFHGFEPQDSQEEDEDLSESEKNHIKSYRFLGQVELDDDNEIGFFEFVSTSTQIENKRVGYGNVLKKLAKEYLLDGAIASFYHPQSAVWRLSFVGFEYDDGRANVTNLKRYTYVLGEDVPIKTPLAQLKNLKYPKYEEIEEAFSVEAITKEFYTGYKALFEAINKELESQQAFFTDSNSDALIETRKFSRKLLGRITFLYFLQKKGWLGVKNKWGDGDKNFLQETFLDCKKNFYLEILTPLFFTALNTQRENSYFKLLDCKIPFLNGGLFTKESYDNDKIILSNALFKKIFEMFNQYNFTIIEDLPHDSEVAIDPEMLGRVFENLIEENYRKGKGAFYTPREIVHYMCQESIIMYLANNFNEKYIQNLVKNGVADNSYIKSNAKKIKANILAIKVLDPAIGSGAFPMGMLHEIMHVLSNIGESQNNSIEKKEIIENSIFGIDIDASAVDIAKLRFWLSIIVDEDEPFPLPNLAFKIMQGNSLIETIDGIDPIPTEIDEPKTKKKQKQLFGKIHQAWDFNKTDAQDHILVLTKKLHQFFDCNKISEKKSIQDAIFSLIKEILEQKIDELENQIKTLQNNFAIEKLKTDSPAVEKKIKKIANDIFEKESTLFKINTLKDNPINDELFLYKLWFGEVLKNGGFDVVIGNPPYLRVQGVDREISQQYKKLFDSATGSYDLYVLFVEKALSLLSEKGTLNYIMPHKWVNSGFGKGLRELVGTNMSKLISFDAYQVFNASTYTSLLWISKKSNKEFAYVELNKDLKTNVELEKYLNSLSYDDYAYIKNNELTKEAWTLTNRETYEILEKIKVQPLFIENIFKYTSQGVVTTGNDIFYLEGKFIDDKFIGFSKALSEEVILEKDIVKPILLGKDIKRYACLQNKYFVIYPHHLIENKTKPFTEEFLKNKYPLTYTYLYNFKDELRAKKIKYKNNADDWFSLTRPREIGIYEQNKLITPQLAVGGYFTYDINSIYIDAGCYSFIKYEDIEESYKFYMSILNSKVCWFFIKNTSAVFSGGYYYYKPIYLNHFKLPKIQNIEDTKPFEILVDYIMWLKVNESIDKYVDNKYIAKLFEEVIDALVYELYFSDEFKEKDIVFLKYAKKYFKPIDNLNEDIKKDIINISYQLLREKDNEIRNNLQLMPIRVPVIVPIMKSI